MAATAAPATASPLIHHQRSSPIHASIGQHKPNTLSSKHHLTIESSSTLPNLPNKNPIPQRSSRTSPHLHGTFQALLWEDFSPDSADYALAVDSCFCPRLGLQIHAHALKRGFCGCREFLETRLLILYGRCNGVEPALQLFEKMPLRSIHSWAGILTVYVDHGLFEEAFFLFKELLVEGVELDFFVFPVVLKSSAGLSALDLGKGLHGFVLKKGFVLNVYVGNALIDMYGKCGAMDDAVKILKGMPERDCVSWNSVIAGCASNGMVTETLEFLQSMWSLGNLKPNLVSWSGAIGGFAQNGYDEDALELLSQMIESGVKPNAQTLASVLPSCGRLEALDVGKEIHGYLMRHELMGNAFVVNGLIDVYRRCGDMSSALELFLRYSVRNLVSYNTMIVGYCENNELRKAKELFDRMEIDGVKRDAISWNSMISGLVDNESFEEALNMFRHMHMEEGVEADSFNLGSILAACAALHAFGQGKAIHAYALKRGFHSNAFVASALVDLYCRCQDLVAAELVFFDIGKRNTVTWNVLISGYARANQVSHSQELLLMMKEDGFEPNVYTWNGLIAGCMENGHNELALQLFLEMQTTKLMPDTYTIGMILPICSRLVSIERGKQVHAHSIRYDHEADVHIGAALVDMYAKCGNIRLASIAFNRISQHNLVSYNTMLAGYAMHGLVKEGLALFNKLLEGKIGPDEITFLSVLCLCGHGGTVEEGRMYFHLMTSYDIKPNMRHYTCMVDLFSRAGQLREAYELIKSMPMEPDAVLWGALLGGCVINCNVELGEIAANRLIEMEEGNVGNYVLLANLYASAGRQDGLVRTRQIIKEKGMHKNPGCSWIEVRDQVHVFLAGDRSHKQTDEIYATAERLNWHMRKYGNGLIAHQSDLLQELA
ncbi:pentatricopeptide repeat-containing protein At1g20230-like [Elaeis guineensis]|uniref:Pentatricopeptide repeat-containing protein At2g13600-like n=1 Tax=Elaeis guineensis var. tenera TaxID=51953 RepID=A0A6I9RWZ7_ELAGV|nr:pentatricopeptide repeat-containing protein At2g13600-like [Elaeis guineensis]